MKYVFTSSTDLIETHLAVYYWRQLSEANSIPTSVDKLSGATNNKSEVYRLNGVGVNGTNVIAKKAKSTGLLVEQMIYEKVLPKVPLNNLRCYGLLQDDETVSWLFLQEAQGKPYAESKEVHRKAASQWLAVMHSTTSKFRLEKALPAVGSERYLKFLNMGYANIQNNLSNPALSENDILVLKRLLNHYENIIAQWHKVIGICNEAIPCLVHGDFISKNVRVDESGAFPILYVLDWEVSGWGIPVEDLAGLDIETYKAAFTSYNDGIALNNLQEVFDLGLLFRYICWVHPTSLGLSSEWVRKTMQRLELYENRIAELTKMLI